MDYRCAIGLDVDFFLTDWIGDKLVLLRSGSDILPPNLPKTY